MNRLAGKRAVVTGAGRGIGRQIAVMYANEGARVLGCDIDAAALAGLGAAQPEIGVHAADLTAEDGAKGLAEAAEQRFGAVDILVNAAAIVKFAPLAEMAFADWKTTTKGEIDTVFLVSRAIWPLLERSGQAAIVNFSSANAHVALKGLPAIAHTAGKGAVLAMTRQMAMEGGPKGIRANAVLPGLTGTEAALSHLPSELRETVEEETLTPYLGAPEDIAHLVAFLASDEARYITGQAFAADGGTSVHIPGFARLSRFFQG